jgi:hypothetical protein
LASRLPESFCDGGKAGVFPLCPNCAQTLHLVLDLRRGGHSDGKSQLTTRGHRIFCVAAPVFYQSSVSACDNRLIPDTG